MMREPEGILKHPYLVPSSPDSPYYSDQLWDWDSWWVSAFLGQVEAQTGEPNRFSRYEEGCILNFLDHTTDDGVMPIQINPRGSFGTATSPAMRSTPDTKHPQTGDRAARGAPGSAARRR